MIFCLVSSHKALQKSTHLSAIFIHNTYIDKFQYVYILPRFWGFVKSQTLKFSFPPVRSTPSDSSTGESLRICLPQASIR
jgi:hypothetical protein